MASRFRTFTLASIAATALAATLAHPALAGDAPYWSGGPHKVGDRSDVYVNPNYIWTNGVVIGDFTEIVAGDPHAENTSDKHLWRYAVLYRETLLSGDEPTAFPLRVLTIDSKKGQHDVLVGKTTTVEEYRATAQKKLSESANVALQATAKGRALDKEARAMLEKWNKRNDRSVKKLTTPEGWRDLALEMALEAGTAKASKALKGKDEVQNIINDTLLAHAKGKIAGSSDLGMPPYNADENAAVEGTKAYVTGILKQKLGEERGESREGLLARMAVEFGARAAKGDPIAEAAYDAVLETAVDWGLGPAGPMGKEALELARQYKGYMETIDKAHDASVEFTKAANAYNHARVARGMLASLDDFKVAETKRVTSAPYIANPELQEFLVSRVAKQLADKAKENGGTLPPITPTTVRNMFESAGDAWIAQKKAESKLSDWEWEKAKGKFTGAIFDATRAEDVYPRLTPDLAARLAKAKISPKPWTTNDAELERTWAWIDALGKNGAISPDSAANAKALLAAGVPQKDVSSLIWTQGRVDSSTAAAFKAEKTTAEARAKGIGV